MVCLTPFRSTLWHCTPKEAPSRDLCVVAEHSHSQSLSRSSPEQSTKKLNPIKIVISLLDSEREKIRLMPKFATITH